MLVKRRDLEKRIRQIAKDKGLEVEWIEGGNHSKVRVGTVTQIVARHREINEHTARSIIRDIEEQS